MNTSAQQYWRVFLLTILGCTSAATQGVDGPIMACYFQGGWHSEVRRRNIDACVEFQGQLTTRGVLSGCSVESALKDRGSAAKAHAGKPIVARKIEGPCPDITGLGRCLATLTIWQSQSQTWVYADGDGEIIREHKAQCLSLAPPRIPGMQEVLQVKWVEGSR